MTCAHLRLSLFIVFSGLLLCNVSSADQSGTETTTTTTTTTQTPNDNGTVTVETTRHVVVTPVPAAKETIATPEGYILCFTVDAGWFNDTWVPTHKVCQYKDTGEGVVWIEGYWGCNKATLEGVCSNWEWKAGHWEKTLAVY